MEKPLLDWMLQRHPETSRSQAKQWVLAGRVSVGGVVLRKPHELMPDPGSALQLLSRHATSLDIADAWPIHPRVGLLHLDASLAIIDKGAGIISVPSDSAEISALSVLADFLVGKLKPQNRSVAARTLPAGFRRLQPLPVHRLDKFTSGAFCAALNPDARQHLLEQLRAQKIRREYIAFVEGRSARAEGIWRHWLELSQDELRQHVVPAADSKSGPTRAQAVTHYRVLAEYPLAESKTVISKLLVRLETGLKHQIRAQAAAEGLPLLGDRLYNPHYREPGLAIAPVPFSRQALHATSIALEHPDRRGEELSWRAEMPKELRQLEGMLRQGRRGCP